MVASIGPRSGGLGPAAVGLMHAQRQLGAPAEIWCLDSDATIADIAHQNGLDERALSRFRITGPWQFMFSPDMEGAAVSQRGAEYEILHQHGIWMLYSRVTTRWRKRFKRPTVVAPHGTLREYALSISAWKKRLASFAYERENLRLASCLHATAEAEALSFRQYGLVNPIAILPNGIEEAPIGTADDAERFRSLFAFPERRLLLFMSRLHPIKGLSLLFEAMTLIRRDLGDWCVVVAGPDEAGHRRQLEGMVQTLGLDGMVRFIGPLSAIDKRGAFASADVFVLPTRSDNFAIVVAEALAAGLPVITTTAAPWEDLRRHQCGWWVDVDAGAIRDAVLDAIHRPREELREMGQRGSALVRDQYLWERSARKSARVYEWLLGRAERPEFVVVD
jgi:glycosyltransferase involved in cell wall biosynthesis